MATLPPDTRVDLAASERQKLTFPPAPATELAIGVHPDALKAGNRNQLTQVVGVIGSSLVWTGAIDEAMLARRPDGLSDARNLIRARLLSGSTLWSIVRPGLLTAPSVRRPLLTIYDGDRPWIVIGEVDGRSFLGVPLNKPSNPKWFTPVIPERDLDFAGSKTSQVELAHLWSLPSSSQSIGNLTSWGRQALEPKVRRYFQL